MTTTYAIPTEEQIERRVETAFDRLDAALIDGRIDQGEYDIRADRLEQWAAQEYALIRSSAAAQAGAGN